jgi:hypothetical protein
MSPKAYITPRALALNDDAIRTVTVNAFPGLNTGFGTRVRFSWIAIQVVSLPA